MFQMFQAAWRHVPVRICAIAIFFFGFAGAATGPFQSVVAIQELGLSDATYSLVIFIAAVINVSASVLIGILADRLGEFRKPLVAVTLVGILGHGLIYFLTSTTAFLIAALVFLPIFGALNSLIFANVRAFSQGLPPAELSRINSAVRATISLSWVLVPGLVGLVLSGASSMLPAYLIALLACCVCLVLFLAFLPPVPRGDISHLPVVRFSASLMRILKPAVLVRIVGVALITSTLHVNAALLPLITVNVAGGTLGDVGIVVGIVAVLEIVFIVFWAHVEPKLGPVLTIGIGTVLYVAYLALLGQCTAPWQVYALSLLSGLGAAAIISLPITYLQSLIPDLAGLGSSLISVNMFLSAGLSALLFGLGTLVSDYSGTALLGGLAGLAGTVLIFTLDGRRQPAIA